MEKDVPPMNDRIVAPISPFICDQPALLESWIFLLLSLLPNNIQKIK
jgi:hypothetical protein